MQQLDATSQIQPDATSQRFPDAAPRCSIQMSPTRGSKVPSSRDRQGTSAVTNLTSEQSIQGLQQREAEVFYHFTFRPKLLSSRGWTAVIKIRAAQSRSIFSFPPPRSCHKAQNLRPHVDMLANSKADPSLENEPVCLGS